MHLLLCVKCKLTWPSVKWQTVQTIGGTTKVQWEGSVVSMKVVLNADDLQFIGFIILNIQAVVAVM